jgi:hypothetical protein
VVILAVAHRTQATAPATRILRAKLRPLQAALIAIIAFTTAAATLREFVVRQAGSLTSLLSVYRSQRIIFANLPVWEFATSRAVAVTRCRAAVPLRLVGAETLAQRQVCVAGPLHLRKQAFPVAVFVVARALRRVRLMAIAAARPDLQSVALTAVTASAAGMSALLPERHAAAPLSAKPRSHAVTVRRATPAVFKTSMKQATVVGSTIIVARPVVMRRPLFA